MRGSGSDEVASITYKGMTIDIASRSLIDATGCEVRLTRGELAVLAALARRPGQVLSRDQLLDAVSGRSAHAFDRSIDNLIARLRRKIEPDTTRPHLILTVKGLGYRLSSRPDMAEAALPSATVVNRRSIRVVPFADPGGSPVLAHSMAAIFASLVSQLRQVVGALVLCPGDGHHDATEIGGQPGARYIVEGCVWRSAGAVRLNARLTDVKTGVPVWADRFHGRLTDLFAFESEVSARIARAIDQELADIECGDSANRAGRLNVPELVINGHAYLYRPRSAKNLATARALFERALRVDGRHAEAFAGLAQTHISDTLCRWSTHPAAQVRLADAAASRAIEINPRLATAWHARGLVLRVRQQHERAAAAFDRAVQLNPSLAPAHAELGFARQVICGNEDGLTQALDSLALARRLSPRDAVLANWLYGIGVAHLKMGKDASAICWLNESIGLNPTPPALAYLAAAYGLIGDDAQARAALREFRRRRPRETLRTFGCRTLADHQILPGSRMFDGLRKAGLREV
jgi:TolB-like protein/Tfp pilus assembly protein PilF